MSRHTLRTKLRQFAAEHAKVGWDDEGADAMAPSTLVNTLRFIDALPMGYAEPDPGVDPDGEFSLSWIGNKGHRLSLSIGPTGRISYAYRFGPRRLNGTEWLGDNIPDELLKFIRTFPIHG